jgi:tetratricopeptide (TPR) repeat protein
VVQRSNVGLYGMYGGDFNTGIVENKAALQINPSFVTGYIGVALSQLGQGHPAEALSTYEELAKVKPDGISAAAAGLADVALYEGRVQDAIKILAQGARDDLASNNPDGAASKFAILAQARLATGNYAAAVQAADQALEQSKEVGIVFWVARAYLGAKKAQKALALAQKLATRLEPDPQAYAKLIEAESAMNSGKTREALQLITDSRKSADTWMGRYDAALAYLDAGKYAEAYSELEVCLKRRGEATAIFLDESPTYHLFPPVYYYLGRAQEGLRSPAAPESYNTFLSFKQGADKDPLVVDAQRRLFTR